MRLASTAAVLLLAMAAGSCGDGEPGDGGAPSTITGRVVSLRAGSYCVSADRGATSTCVEIPEPGAVEGIDVGECVTTTLDLAPPDGAVDVVDESECATGDLGG